MFGFSEALLGFIRRQIGLRTDAASATGSLHSKIADLKNYISSLVFGTRWESKSFNVVKYSHPETFFTIPANTSLSLISLSGSGIVSHIDAYAGNSASLNYSVVIDGVERELGTADSTSRRGPFLAGLHIFAGTNTAVPGLTMLTSPIKYNSSFQLRLKNINPSDVHAHVAAKVHYHY